MKPQTAAFQTTRNQCDGCAMGWAVQNGNHVKPLLNRQTPHIACTADRYRAESAHVCTGAHEPLEHQKTTLNAAMP